MVCVTGISQTMAVWKTVLPNSSLFTNREWVWLKFHGLWTVQCVICPSLALLAKDTVQLKWWGNLAKPWYNDKTPPFFSGLWLKTPSKKGGALAQTILGVRGRERAPMRRMRVYQVLSTVLACKLTLYTTHQITYILWNIVEIQGEYVVLNSQPHYSAQIARL